MSDRSDSKEDLFQQLLELEYGLLDEPEAQRLRERIDFDTDVARLYAEVRRTRGLLAEAAVIEVPNIVLERPRSSSYSRSGRHHRRHRTGWSSILAVAAALFLSMGIGGEWWFQHAANQVTNDSIVINLAGPSTALAGGLTPVEIQTQNLRDEPVAAQIDVALIDRQGHSIAQKQVATSRSGQATVFLPTASATNAPFTLVASRPLTPSAATSIRPEYAPRVTRLSTDRPVYRPGERLYFRALTLERESFKPVDKGTIDFDLRDPQGNKLPEGSITLPIVQGVAAGSISLSSDLSEGSYRLTANSPTQEFVEQSRMIEVRTFREPRLRKRLELDSPTVTAGSTLKGELIVENDDGKPLSDAPVHVQAELDNMVIQNHEVTLDKDGKTQFWFSIPNLVRQGPLNIDVSVGKGVNAEQLNRQVPLTQGPLDLEFFPESGPLIAGLRNQIYFQAFDVNSKPVSVAGRIVDDRGTAVAEFKAEHEGRGRFELQPEIRRTYRVELIHPQGATSIRSFPNVVSDQEVILHGGKGVFDGNEPLDLAVISSAPNIPFIVSAYCRQVPVGFVLGRTIKGKLPVRLNVLDGTDGVVRVTIFDRRTTPIRPVAERLVYRRPVQKLNVSMTPEISSSSPQSLAVHATNEKGAPAVGATLGVSIIDQRILELSQERPSGIDAHFLLLSEIRRPQDIENADFLLRNDAASARALDLVLGTHGWRQFRPAMLQNVIAATTPEEWGMNPAAVQEPAFSDNVSAVQETVKQQLATLHVDQQWYRITTLAGMVVLVLSFIAIRSRSFRLLSAIFGVFLLGLLLWQLQLSRNELSRGPHQMAAASSVVPQEPASSEASQKLGRDQSIPKPTTPSLAPVAPALPPMPVPAENESGFQVATPGSVSPENPEQKSPTPREIHAAQTRELVKDKIAAKEESRPSAIAEVLDQKKSAAEKGVAPAESDRLSRSVADALVPAPAEPSAAGVAAPPAPAHRYAEGSRAFAVAREKERSPTDRPRMVYDVERNFSSSFRPNLAQEFVRNPTAYWNPLLSTDEQGKATITFDPTSDKVTYVISIEGHTSEGRLGSLRTEWRRPDSTSDPSKKANR